MLFKWHAYILMWALSPLGRTANITKNMRVKDLDGVSTARQYRVIALSRRSRIVAVPGKVAIYMNAILLPLNDALVCRL
jgi:hypothetical protein